MKYFFFLTLFSTSVMAYDRIPLLTGKIYIPEGYDDNDLIEVSVSGKLPDLCHRNPTYEVERVGNEFKVSLYAYYVPLPNGCKKVSIPFLDTVSLGMLPKGAYALTLSGVKTEERPQNFKVAVAKSNLMDDFRYGNVMGILENDVNREIELVGTKPVNCLRFKKLVTEVQASVIVLRPQFEEVGECEQKPTSFNIKYKVPYLNDHPRGLLLHVRVMDGRSFNYLYQNSL